MHLGRLKLEKINLIIINNYDVCNNHKFIGVKHTSLNFIFTFFIRT